MRQAGPPPPLRISSGTEPPATPPAYPAPAPPPPASRGPQTCPESAPSARLRRDTPRARRPRPRCTLLGPRGLPSSAFTPARAQADPGPSRPLPRSVLHDPDQVPRVGQLAGSSQSTPSTLPPQAGCGAAGSGRRGLGLGVGDVGGRAALLMGTQLSLKDCEQVLKLGCGHGCPKSLFETFFFITYCKWVHCVSVTLILRKNPRGPQSRGSHTWLLSPRGRTGGGGSRGSKRQSSSRGLAR